MTRPDPLRPRVSFWAVVPFAVGQAPPKSRFGAGVKPAPVVSAGTQVAAAVAVAFDVFAPAPLGPGAPLVYRAFESVADHRCEAVTVRRIGRAG